MAKRILVVDDEPTLCEALRFNLEAEGYQAQVAYSAEEALTLDLAAFDLVLLDIMMGDISGIQLARIMRSAPATRSVPIIFCTARADEEDMMEGLDIGADDYVTKPYSIRGVLARVRAVLRRGPLTGQQKPEAVSSYRGLCVDADRMTCTVDGREVRLPRKEFEILRLLLSQAGRIFKREEILRAVWPDEVVVLDRVVDVNMARIRSKIGPYGKNIVSRSGYGYGFVE